MAIVTPVKTATGGHRRLQLASPADLEPIGEIEIPSKEDVVVAVETARKAQLAWGALSPKERGSYMLKALNILLDEQDRFIKVIERETPKPRIDVIQIDIFPACDALYYYAKETGRLLKTEKKKAHGVLGLSKQLRIVYKPVGVVGIISPWNGPFVLSIVPTIQALMAGNAVILKPSSLTAHTGLLVGDLFRQAGLPLGVLTVLTGDGSTGAALIESGVDKISFTGSVEVGREVAKACAERLIPCTLELGGKDPMIICADADLENAVGGAMAGSFTNTGQYCCGTERVYVVDSVADAFIRMAVERTSKLRQASEGEFDVGAIFSLQQIKIVDDHVKDAVARGAKVLIGGRRNPGLKGLYYEPTVLVDVTHDMLVMKEETFGPIMPIMRVANEEEAIRLANDSRFGLAASVYTRNKQKGFDIARRINSGSVNINDMTVTYGVCEAPFGGVKESGVGRVNGEMGLKGYCHIQPILTDRLGGKQTASAYPCTQKKEVGMQKFMKFLWGSWAGRKMAMLRLPI